MRYYKGSLLRDKFLHGFGLLQWTDIYGDFNDPAYDGPGFDREPFGGIVYYWKEEKVYRVKRSFQGKNKTYKQKGARLER